MKKKPIKENLLLKVAILVDGDNASSAKLGQMVDLASHYGAIAVKRIYGDWTRTSLSHWKEPAGELSFRLIEAMPYVKGKNTTDIALIIDAMVKSTETKASRKGPLSDLCWPICSCITPSTSG